MDLPQLQLLASRVRDLLQHSNHGVGHNQSLDLIAALPGLRNWPEVRAFPDRVASCELDESSASRLAFRLRKRFGLELSVPDILLALNGAGDLERTTLPEMWPAGPVPGVYVTTSQTAIDAIVAKYEEATDGAILYAERAANRAQGAIDLGDDGLWSSGLERVPSGTLIVVGPIELVQDEWERSTDRLQMACTLAETSGHRVVVLAETPTPENLCEDMRLMSRTAAPEGVEYESGLRGLVTEDGDLVQRTPFAKPWPRLKAQRNIATAEAIPSRARDLLSRALRGRKSGLLVFGGDAVQGHWAADLVDASLALTEHVGPAARIMPRMRSTPAKNWWVPEATKQLPFLPSIQSAYDRGYRRMLIDPHQVDGEVIKQLARDVLFIAGTHGYEASTILFSGVRAFGSASEEMEILTQIIGLLGVARLPSQNGILTVSDLFIGPGIFPAEAARIRDIAEYVSQHRVLKWEDQVQLLLSAGEITTSNLSDMAIKPPMLAQFARQIGQHLKQTSTRQ